MRRPLVAGPGLADLIGAGSDCFSHLSRPQAVGYVCSYVPEEIILAAGLDPVRLGACKGPVGPVDSSLQSFACSFVRALVDGLLAGAGHPGRAVFAYTCDSLRAAYEVWKLHAPEGTFVHFLNMPARVEGPGVLPYATSEFERLARALERLDGARQVTDENLAEATALIRSIRASLARLSQIRRCRPDLLPGSVLLGLARGASVIDRREAARILAALAAKFEAAAGSPAAGEVLPQSAAGLLAGSGRPRLLVSGGFLEEDEALRLIEQAGADVVADDLCLLWRQAAYRAPEAPASAVPLARLAASYLGRVPCPAKHPPGPRFDRVVRLAVENQVDGVVFLLQKSCDPHAFDYPDLARELEKAGRPSLVIEVEQGGLPAGQAMTRMEAFLERLARKEALA